MPYGIPMDYTPLLPLYYLRMEIEIVEGFEDFEDAVSNICSLPPKNRSRLNGLQS